MKKKAAQLYVRFAEAYVRQGENATQAYLVVKPHVTRLTAGVEGHRLLKNPKVVAMIDKRRAELRAKFALTTDRVVQELARIAYFNPRRMLDAKGKPLSLAKMDDDTAASLTLELDGQHKVLKVRTVSPSAKNTAVEKAVKILRLYDKPPPPPPDPTTGQPEVTADPRDTARRMLFLLRQGTVAAERQAAPVAKPVKKKVTLPA